MNRIRKTACLVLALCMVMSIPLTACGKKEPAASETKPRKQPVYVEATTAPEETAATEETAVTEETAAAEETAAPKETAETTAAAEETLPVEETAAAEETTPVEETAAGETTGEEEDVQPQAAASAEPADYYRDGDVVRTYYDQVPHFFNSDYPDVMYGGGKLGADGSAMGALAMVASYMVDYEYHPDDMAYYFGGSGDDNVQRFENGCKTLQLAYESAQNFYTMVDAVKEGKVAIVMVSKNAGFSSKPHFLVVTGVTEEGNLLLQDPYQPNYEKTYLQDGYENGFRQGKILGSYQRAWIFDKSAMPEEPFVYFKPDRSTLEPRYPDIQLTDAEKTMLAKLIWAEARSESQEGQQAVAEVVINRLAMEGFPKTLRGVIYAKGQFLGSDQMYRAKPTQTQYDAVEAAIYGPYILPKEVVLFGKFQANKYVWGKIGSHTFCYSPNHPPEETVPETSVPETTVPETSFPTGITEPA